MISDLLNRLLRLKKTPLPALVAALLAIAAVACTATSSSTGGNAGSSGTSGTSTSGGGGSTGSTSTTGTSGGSADPLVGSWESEYATEGHLDTFEIRPDLTGTGTYYSVLPGIACAVQITAQHGVTPGNYVGILTFGSPCNAATPMAAFDCMLVDRGARLVCEGDKSYRRVNSMGSGGSSGAGGSPTSGAGGGAGSSGVGGSGAGGNGGTGPAGAAGSGGGATDPLVGSWESEYLTLGQRDTFDIGRDLTGMGTYYSVMPGVSCPVDIAAVRGLAPNSYVGTLDFGPPCDSLMSAFNCSLTDAAARLVCEGSKNYRRVR